MSAAVAALLFLAATALPARAEDFANDPARAWPHTVRSEQRPVFGGTIARQPGTATGGLVQPRTRNEASNAANAPTQSDADDGSFVPPFATDPHMYDYLSSSAYRGGA